MLKLLGGILAAGLATASAAAPVAVLGPDAEACAAGAAGPAFLVRIDGFKARTGMLRVQLYGPRPEDFLAKGKKLRRIEMPVSAQGPMEVCMALPGTGDFAVVARHDVDGDGKSGWNDGGGFSRNPRGLTLLSYKPDFRNVVVRTAGGVKQLDVTMQYRQGFSIGPIAMATR